MPGGGWRLTRPTKSDTFPERDANPQYPVTAARLRACRAAFSHPYHPGYLYCVRPIH